jgi:nicotinamide-nucleotide adenylyltransferase
MIARWKPVHLGHAAILEDMCRRAERVFIGIGSANRYNADNPFTAAETAQMIQVALGPEAAARCDIVGIPDFDDGPRWSAYVSDLMGPLDAFVTANPYVRSLLEPHYTILHPLQLVPPSGRFPIDGTMVRAAMRAGEPWEHLVPPAVAAWIIQHGLVERVRSAFGTVVGSAATRSSAAP